MAAESFLYYIYDFSMWLWSVSSSLNIDLLLVVFGFRVSIMGCCCSIIAKPFLGFLIYLAWAAYLYHHLTAGAWIYLNGTLFRVSLFVLLVVLHVDLMMACSVTDIRDLISGFWRELQVLSLVVRVSLALCLLILDPGICKSYYCSIILMLMLNRYVEGDVRVCCILYGSVCGGSTWMLGF